MKSNGIVCLILLVSVLVLVAGCTSQQTVAPPTTVTTVQSITTTGIPSTGKEPVTTGIPVIQSTGPRQLLVNKSWKVQSWHTEQEIDQKNASVQQFMADYHRRANDTFTWYENGTLAYRYANGTVYTTGTWNLTKNTTAIIEKYSTTDGFYLDNENEILNLSNTIFVIRYPAKIAGKEYFFIETQSVQT